LASEISWRALFSDCSVFDYQHVVKVGGLTNVVSYAQKRGTMPEPSCTLEQLLALLVV
jgi:hypothetical protein